jgi:hypothetical protein
MRLYSFARPTRSLSLLINSTPKMGTSLFSPGLHAACIFAFAQPEVSDDCSSYALGFFSQPGGNDCTSSPNSIFSGAKMYGLGSASVTAADLQLVCASLPFYTTGIFF